MSGNEVDLLQWESLVSGSEGNDCSVIVCSVVNHSVHSVVTTPSDLSSVESSVVSSEEV